MFIPSRLLLGVMALAFATAVPSVSIAKGPNLVSGGMSWLLHAEPIPVDGKTARVRMGDFLFVQPLSPAAEAVPSGGQVGVLPPAVFGKGTTVALDGHRFGSTAGGVDGTTYCTIDDDITNRGQRLCLIDVNDDARFDYQGRAFGLGNGQPYARMLLAANVIPTSVPYAVRNGGTAPLMHAGIVIRKDGKSFELKFAVSEKGKPRILDLFQPEHRFLQQRRANVATSRFSGERLPVKIELYGALVEILAVSENDVTYRLLSGFDGKEPIVVSRAGRLPVQR